MKSAPKPEPIQQVEPAPAPIDRTKRRNNARALSAAGFKSSILSDLATEFGGMRSTLG